MSKPKRYTLIFLFGLIVLYALGIIFRTRAGIAVTVDNKTGDRLYAVRAIAKPTPGTTYIGDMPAGERRTIYIRPLAESHIELHFSDAKGFAHSQLIVGYMEEGYCGTASAEILRGNVISAHQNIDVAWCPGGWFSFLRPRYE